MIKKSLYLTGALTGALLWSVAAYAAHAPYPYPIEPNLNGISDGFDADNGPWSSPATGNSHHSGTHGGSAVDHSSRGGGTSGGHSGGTGGGHGGGGGGGGHGR